MSQYKPTPDSGWEEWPYWVDPTKDELDGWIDSGEPCLKWESVKGATPVEIYGFESPNGMWAKVEVEKCSAASGLLLWYKKVGAAESDLWIDSTGQRWEVTYDANGRKVLRK